MASPPGFERSLATIAFEMSIPLTGTPRRESGSAIRPVPTPNSSARPAPASATSKATAGIYGRWRFSSSGRRSCARVHAMDDDTPEIRPHSPKPGPRASPTEAELSRIARDAVHQAPDARLDRELARMGLLDPSELAEPRSGRPTGRSPAIDPELERLRNDLRRLTLVVVALVAASAILAVTVVVLLFR